MLVNCSDVHGQFTDRYWCFGDSAGIDFSSLNIPVPGHSILRARGTCVSICDSTGNLLFYAGSPDVDLWLNSGINDFGYVINKNHQKMQNGDSLKSNLWYQEMIIVPDPGNINRFYLFTVGVTGLSGFYYSVVDLSLNSLDELIDTNSLLSGLYLVQINYDNIQKVCKLAIVK